MLFKLPSKISLKSIYHQSLRYFCDSLPEGIQYHGFTYYPRHKGFKDPPYTPSKLFLIKKIKPGRGKNPEEKDALRRLNIDGHRHQKGHIAIVKNIPQINALLWKVKHMIDIKPITFSGDIPEDFSGTYLRETGELVISPKLKVSEITLQKSDEIENSSLKMRKHYIKSLLRTRWNNGEYNI